MSEISGNFEALIEHGPHWINFIILTFISLKNKNKFRGFYKIWSKIISFDMKKKVKCKTCHEERKEKGEFESPWNEFLRLKCGTPIMLEPLCTKVTYKN
jgi:hypothetical protein